MITKEESIVTQVAAKIAAEITCSLNTGGNIEAALLDFDLAFGHVRDALFKSHAADMTAAFTEAFPNSTPVAAAPYLPERKPASAPAPQAQYSQQVSQAPAALKIAGTQHGPLPEWIVKDAARAGITELWDNRDKAVGTKRPHFKQAGRLPEGQEAVAFWPPKGVAA